jgi:large repetitive protein
MKRFSAVFLSFLSLLLAFPAVVKAAEPSTPGVVGTVNLVSKTATSISISWSAPSDSGMLSIDDYLVQFRIAGGSWSTFADGVGTSTSATVTGLVRGSSYSFRVAAVNALGQGPYLEHVTAIIPAVLPAAPSNVTVLGTHRSDQYSPTSRTITWTASDNGGRPISDYAIEVSVDGNNWQPFWDGESALTSATVTGLIRDQSYVFRVSAVTAEGRGPFGNTRWWKDIAWGNYKNFCGVDSDGRVFCWGSGANGVTEEYFSQPATAISIGDNFLCVILQDQTTRCKGNTNSYLQVAGVGVSFVAGQEYEPLPTGLQVTKIDSGSTFSCALSVASKIYCWGSYGTNSVGTGSRDVPVSGSYKDFHVEGPRVAALNFSPTSNMVYWGYESSTRTRTSPAQQNSTYYDELSDDGLCVIQAGVPNCPTVSGPMPVAGIPALDYVSGSQSRLCGAINGVLHCSGVNTYGQLGIGNAVNQSSLQRVLFPSARTIKKTAGIGNDRVCALMDGGQIYCWGRGGTALGYWWPSTDLFPNPLPSMAVKAISTVPDSPGIPQMIQKGENSVTVGWSAPLDDGGNSLSDYVIQHSTNGSNWNTFDDGVTTSTSATISGLSRGVSHQFRVAAVNSLGPGAYSAASGSSMPAVVPRAPLSLKVTRWTGGYKTASADLSWTSPDNGGQSVTDFNIEYRVSGDLVWTSFSDGVSISQSTSVSGLTRASSYEFRVRAVNAEGAGPWTYSSAESISAGGSQTCVVQVDGQTKCWGANSSGQLGDGTSVGKSTPVTMLGTTRGVSNAVGVSHSCVLTALGLVYCVGSNSVGQLGDGTGTTSSALVQVAGLSGVTKIAAGGSTTCAVLGSGTVRCWGAGASGQLGNGSTNDALLPVSVTGVSGATAITVGTTHACATVASGAVQCWGNNASGQLGNSTTTDSLIAVSVTSLTGAVSVSAGGSSTCAVLASGVARCWGSNASRQLGNASSVNSSSPVTVSGVMTATKVVSGSSHSCVLLADSSVQCWGNNVSGQLGNATTATQDVPVTSTGVSSAIDIAAGSLFTCVVKASSGVDCWGSGASGQLGDGLSTSSDTAVSAAGIAIVSVLVPVTGPSAPLSLSEVSHNDTQVILNWSAPSDNGGSPVTDYKIEYKPAGGSWIVFSDGTSTSTSVTVSGLTRGTRYTFRVTGVNAVEDGDISLVSVEITPSVVPGEIRSLQLLTFSNSSVSVSWQAPADDGGSSVTDYKIEYKPAGGSWTLFSDGISTSTLGVISGLQQGTLYSIRVSAANANGSGSTSALSSDVRPATFPGLVSGLQVVNYSSSAIQISWTAGTDGGESITDYIVEYTTGTTWTVLNDGVSTVASATISGIGVGQYVRIRVKAENSVGAGSYVNLFDEGLSGFDMSGHTCAIGTSGSVWCSGQNYAGQLGDGTIGAHYQFSRVLNVSSATKVATGWDHSCAIVALGAVKCWGSNATGQLGDGTTTSSRRAVSVSGVSGAAELSAGRGYTCAVLTSGAVKCWGDNSQRQLGDNSAVAVSATAVDVAGITTANKLAAAQYTACVLLVDTTVRCWGDNRYGQVSNGGVVSPIGVPSTARFGASSNLQDVVSISSDPFADVFCVNTVTGSARCWGTNNVFQRGNNNTSSNPYMTTPNGLSSGVQSIEVGGGHACASLTGNIIRCWGYNVQGGASGGASRANVAIPTTVTGASGSKLLLGLYSSCSYSNSSDWQCWGLNSSFERGDGGPDGGGPYSVDVSRQALLVVDKPSQPSSVQVTRYSTSSVSLSWTAPSSTGGLPIYDYAIDVKTGSGAWTRIDDGVATQTTFTWNSAVKGSAYLFRVSALNLSELSSEPVGTSSSVFARVVPGIPTSLRETTHTDSSVTFAWDAPVNDGGSSITDYILEYRDAATSTWRVFEDGMSSNVFATVTGLTKGTRYEFRVAAVTDEGTGPTIGEFVNPVSWGKVACSVGASGAVWCSGESQFGSPLGNGYERVRIPGISNATQVSVGADSTCALLGGGTVKCWGFNGWGQLGNGTFVSSDSPVDVSGLTNVVQIEVGQTYACARKSDGTVWCWGNGDVSRNGTGTTTSTPVQLTSITGASDLSLGDGMGCVLIGGGVKCWGYAVNGRLGNPFNGAGITSTPQIVRTSAASSSSAYHLSNVVEISSYANAAFTCARKSDGAVFCWGDSSVSQAGLASGSSTFARQISGITGASSIAIGALHGCVLASAGSVWCWGWNAAGMVGDGTLSTRTSAVRVVSSGASWVSAGHLNSSAFVNGRIHYWGDNDFGQQSRPISPDITDDILVPTDQSAASMVYATPATLSSAPSNLISPTFNSNAVDLRWSVPLDNGGQEVIDYRVQYKENTSSTWLTFSDGTSVTPSVIVTGLTRGLLYDFRVAAITAEGVGTYSDIWRQTPSVAPAAVGSFVSDGHTVSSVDLSWTAPPDDGGLPVLYYSVEYQLSGGAWTQFGNGMLSSTNTTVTGLTKGGTYSFRVSAKNQNGVGSASASVSVVPATFPSSTSITSESHVATSVTLNWSAPSDNGGRAVTDYVVQYKLSSDTNWLTFVDAVSTALSTEVTGLTRGQSYDFRVAAKNFEGMGAFGTGITAIPSVVPGAVGGLSSPNHSTTSVSLSWVAPSDDGGRPISDYLIEYQLGAYSAWIPFSDGVSTDTAATVTGLSRGSTYSFRVSAVNANGSGVLPATVTVIPATVPSAPSISTITAPVAGASAQVNFSVSDQGGRSVDQVQYRLDGGAWTIFGSLSLTSLVIPGLVNGQQYSVEIRARNFEGFSAESNALNVTPAAKPTAPVLISVGRPTEGSKLALDFSPANGQGRMVTKYQYSLNGSTWLERTDGQTTASPLIINTGLTNGTPYRPRLRAVNEQGLGPSSSFMEQVPGAVPSAPAISRLEPSDGALGVVFTPPTSNGGLVISNYEYSINGGQTWIARSPASVTSPWTVSGLSNGTSYSVLLRSVNAQGGGAESTSLTATPAALPSSPTISAVSRPVAGGILDVDFVAPSNDGGAAITKYQFSVNGGVTWIERTDSVGPTVSPMRISGLVNGTTYQVTVRAVNARGFGVSSQIFEAIPAAIPSAPTGLTSDTPPAGQSARINFMSGASNGDAISGYEYSTNNGTTWVGRADGLTVESPISIDGLQNGTTYLVRIRAVNSQGSGQASGSIAVTPATTPGRASIASLDYGESRIFVNVTAPGNGGSPITSYAYSIDGEETWYDTNSSSTSFSIGGLVNGRTYPVAVSAENRQGYGESSGISYITIGAKPDAVTTGAADVTASTVRLEGQVSANFVSTTTEFQLSTSSDFSTIFKTVAGSPLSGAALTNIAVDVTDIVESTTYFYRIVARNALGATFGSVLSFRTNGPLGITANNGSIYTNSTNVSMGVSWPRGSTAVILSNDGGFGVSSRFSLGEIIPWTLQSSGNERLPKTIYARFVLADGSRSSTYTDDIILDETAPVLQDVISSSYEGDTVSVASLSKRMLSVRASDGNSGVARFELRSSAVAPSVFVSAPNPEATQHSVAVASGSSVIEVRVLDRAGNASGWKPVTLNSSASGTATATPSPKPTVSASVKLAGTTAKVSVKLPSTLAKTCATKVVKGKKTSVCTPATIVVSVSGGGSKTVKAKAGSNAITVPKAKKGATVTIKVNGKVVEKIKM